MLEYAISLVHFCLSLNGLYVSVAQLHLLNLFAKIPGLMKRNMTKDIGSVRFLIKLYYATPLPSIFTMNAKEYYNWTAIGSDVLTLKHKHGVKLATKNGKVVGTR